MVERDADGLALVLEDEDVVNESKRAKLREAIRPDAHQLVYLLDRLCGERRRVIRRIDYDLTDAF